MAEYNPPPLAYRPRDASGEAAELQNSLLAPLRFRNERKQRDQENTYRNATLARETERDRNANERDRISQEQRARQMLSEDKRAGQRESLYATREARRQEEAMFNRNRLLQQEHEALIKELHDSLNDPGQDPIAKQNRIKAAQEALHRAGYATAEDEDTPDGPTLPSPVAPAPEAPYDSTLGDEFLPAEQDGPGVSMGRGGTAKPVPKLPAKKKLTPRETASLSTQLDNVDPTQGMSKLPPTPFLPGQNPVAPRPQSFQVAQSNAMLSPDDPLNNPPQ